MPDKIYDDDIDDIDESAQDEGAGNEDEEDEDEDEDSENSGEIDPSCCAVSCPRTFTASVPACWNMMDVG